MGALTVGLAQLAAGPSVADNLADIEAAVTATADAGARLVVLPEGAMAAFPERGGRVTAEPLDDSTFVDGIARLSAAHEVWIVAGMFESAADDLPYDTVVVTDPDGRSRASYRKIHLFDALGVRESDMFSAGTDPVVVDVDGVRVGLLICYDLRFPEMARALVDQGAELLVAPSAWYAGPEKLDHWRTLLRARAIENTAWVAAACQPSPTFVGASTLIDPFGVVVAELGAHAATTVATVDPERTAEVRTGLPSLSHRRFPTATGPAPAATEATSG